MCNQFLINTACIYIYFSTAFHNLQEQFNVNKQFIRFYKKLPNIILFDLFLLCNLSYSQQKTIKEFYRSVTTRLQLEIAAPKIKFSNVLYILILYIHRVRKYVFIRNNSGLFIPTGTISLDNAGYPASV